MNIFELLGSMVVSRIKPFTNKIKKLTNANVQKNKLVSVARKGYASLFRIAPENKSDYYPIFGWLVSKRLAMAIVVSVCILCASYIAINMPKRGDSNIPYKAYKYNSIPLKFTTDKVQILGKSGYCAYVGDVENGVVKGSGTLYSKSGERVYEGSFEANAYNGRGRLYYEGEALHYDGDFTDNLFNGQGQLYRENGSLIYNGSFLNGVKEGEGVLFNASNKAIFTGSFSADEIRYSDFLGKMATDIATMYTGDTEIYLTQSGSYNIYMKEIDALYGIKDGSNSLDEEAEVEDLYVLEPIVNIHGKKYCTIPDIKQVLGAPIYEGNTALNGRDEVALNLAIDKLGEDVLFGKAAGKETRLYDDVISFEEPLEEYLCYWYVFMDEGVVYTFYCRDKDAEFAFYRMELE